MKKVIFWGIGILILIILIGGIYFWKKGLQKQKTSILPLQEQLTKIGIADKIAIDKLEEISQTSPDGKYRAITKSTEDGGVTTYIAFVQGQKITGEYCGSFKSWMPDSNKIILYLSDPCGDVEKIYYLDLKNNYYDSGLPRGAISAAVSSLNRSIIYSLKHGKDSGSDIFIRDTKNEDHLLFEGGNNYLGKITLSPKGDKILFFKEGITISNQKQTIWVANIDGTHLTEISGVDWNYPAVWSSDGRKINFIYDGYVWEYKVNK